MGNKVLVIDDSETFQETIKTILSLEGFDVITASNGNEGLARIYSDSPDLVLLDCVMPGIDGYDVVRAMREDSLLFNKPVIMLTGKDTEYDEIKGLELGIDDYIVKPFDPPVLISRIKAIFSRYEQNVSPSSLALLTGNTAIKEEVEKRLARNVNFAFINANLNNFKSFNFKYGFKRGDELIKSVINLLLKVVRESGSKDDFVGYITGDDFVILTSPEKAEEICKKVINVFDETISACYDEDDKSSGYILVKDRKGEEKKYFLVNITLAIILSASEKASHFGQLISITSEIIKIARQNNKSTYFVDRRKK